MEKPGWHDSKSAHHVQARQLEGRILWHLSVHNGKQTDSVFQCTIDESVKGAASLRRYGITFDGNIHI